MSEPIRLVSMTCLRCQNPLPAQPDEVAWLCDSCGQGMLLSEIKGLTPLDFHFNAGIPANVVSKPYWVAQGQVTLTRRETYRGNREDDAQAFWQQPRLFFVPAFQLPLEQIIQYGTQLLQNPVPLQEGARVRFEPVTVTPEDMRSLAEFLILGIEASRKDQLRKVEFELRLSLPQLWII
jgi:hypothetical protein